MSDEDRLRHYLKQVATDLHATRGKLREFELAAGEPIAIVGMGCRLPGGVEGPADLWNLLDAGVDAVGPLPADRGWNVADLGTAAARQGGFVHSAADFDAEFFDISPREALAMDPQQRLLLEVSWEAIEQAGLDPRSLKGSRTGVYVGGTASGYDWFARGRDAAEGHLVAGSAISVLSGRIAYNFGLTGPAVSIDTACSSSLLAIHLAVRALRAGECSAALAGGVMVMVLPGMFAEFSRQGGLAADGRCKSFGADADGTGWGEGVGVVVLERLSDAQRLGHQVLAVIRGSAANQDGASNGLTAPNGAAQQRVIRDALAGAGLTPADIDAVEAHGTGTELGDPVEADALLAAYGAGRDRPLWLGSLKSNLGHTQTAAGVAAVIKMVQALRHHRLPATLHAETATPHVDWSVGDVRLLTEGIDWPAGGRPRRAGVSAFGASGTNVHLILEEAPAAAEPAVEPETGRTVPSGWPVSARSPRALRAQAARLHDFLLADPDADPAAVACSLVATRSAFEHRAVVTGADRSELLAGLAALAAGDTAQAITGTARPGRIGFVFAGQGSQRAGMARELHQAHPVFAAAFDSACELIEAELGQPIREVALSAGPDERADQTCYAQTGLFALQVGLLALLAAHGVRPDAVAGHSVGEIAAAHAAGVLSLADAARLVAHRARLMQSLPTGGAMAAIEATEAELGTDLDAAAVSLAAVNGPRSVVISGSTEAVTAVADRWRAQHRRVRSLRVSHAFHSAAMDPILDELAAIAAGLTLSTPRVLWAGALHGELVDTPDAGYWPGQARGSVRFAAALQTLADRGVGTFLEIGPDGTLSAMGAAILPDAGFVPLASRDAAGAFGTGLAKAWVRGVPVAFARPGRRVALPTYAFDHRRYWPAERQRPQVGTDDSRLWSVVEAGDLTGLAGELDLPEQALPGVLPALAAWRHRERDEAAAADLRYRIDWDAISPAGASLSGDWLIIGAERAAGLGELLATALRARGAEVTFGDGPDGRRLSGVLSLLALDETPHPELELPVGMVDTLALAQSLTDTPLWIVTRGAVAAAPGEPTAPAQAQAWGFGRVVGLEHPQRWGGLIDLPPAPDDLAAQRLAAVLAAGDGEDQVAIRPAGSFGRRLRRAPRGPVTARWTPRGRVLITGGTGALGDHVARWLTTRGTPALTLALVSRRGPAAAGVAAQVAQLAGSGSTIEVFAADIAVRDQVAALLGRAAPTAVFHAAGIGQATPLNETTAAEQAEVTRAKAAGAQHLDELTSDLDAFVVFSSVSATWGSAWQPGYAAANAHLDALVEARRARGLAGTSIAWGLWGGGGLGDSAGGEQARRRGLRPMDPTLAMRALGQALEEGEDLLTVADVDWAAFGPAFTLRRPSPLLAGLVPSTDTVAPATADAPTRAALAALPRTEQDRELVRLVCQHTASLLGHSAAADIDPERAFSELGFDSLTSMELRDRLATATGLTLSATLVFDHPSPVVLAAHLRSELSDDVATADPVLVAAADTEPIAIVGVGMRLPGGISTPDQLWNCLVSGTDLVGAFPIDRGWELPDGEYAPVGGFLTDAADFDPDFFGIPPRETLAMDPQQRLLLEVCWEALERAGLDPRTLRGSRTGVFAGAAASGYGTGTSLAGDSQLMMGTATSILSGRIAYTLGLEGPALTVDTACSSSLVALHLAVRSLRSGECTLALAGGVTVMADPAVFAEFARQQGLASDGRCKAFAAGADGTGWAEGAGMLAVERLSDAQRLGHQVFAVIRGSAVNSDGASNGLTAPNGPSQQRVIRAALADARLNPADIDAIEAHGTGTALGDPIEAQALLATYGRDRGDRGPVWLGSVKSNFGHAQQAAGVIGVLKLVTALRHGVLPATLHAQDPSPHVDWTSGQLELLQHPVDWPAGERPRRAGVSAFGISGTNAHVIIEEPPAPVPVPPIVDELPPVWPVSARTPAELAAQAGRLREHVLAHPELSPADLGWSLASTRTAFEHRAVITGADRDELLAGLVALATGEPAANTVTGTVRPGRIGFVFAGQGSQRAGMGRELYAASPVFATAFDEACELIAAELGADPREVVLSDVEDERADQTRYAQTGLFAVQVGLLAMLAAHGIRPDAVAGHSVGEIAAAYAAGVLTLADAARLVAARARLMQSLPAGGAMAAIEATESEIVADLAGSAVLSLAAVNGPLAVTVSGDEDAVQACLERWRERGRRVRRLRVSHAFHSHRMEPALAELAAVADGLAHAEPAVPWAGALAGTLVTEPDAGYWTGQARGAVRFAAALQTLAAEGVAVFLEIGPDGTLSATGAATLPDSVFVPLLHKQNAAGDTVREALARAWVHGAPLDLGTVTRGRPVELPTYAFGHRRFWPQRAAARVDAADSRFWTAVESGDLSALPLDAGRPLRELLPELTSWRQGERHAAITGPWRYRTSWLPVGELPSATLAGTWLVVGDAPEIAAALSARGADVVVCAPDDLAQHRDLDLRGVLSVLALDETPDARFPVVPAGVAATIALLQALDGIDAPLWLLTRGAVDVDGDRVSAAGAQVWGLGRVAALEHPERWGGLIDLPAPLDDHAADRLCAVLASAGEDQVALRASGVLARRLVRAAASSTEARAWQPRGSVLISGGTGGLAGHVARWLTDRTVPRLVLLSRSGPVAADLASLARSAAAGTGVEVLAADIADRGQVAAVLARVPDLTAVVHTAGVGQATALADTDLAEHAAVTGAKVAGAQHLDALTADLDAFVVFSSIAASWGSGRQPGYAAANAAIEAIAADRRARGLAATSIAWGLWDGDGMGAGDSGAAAETVRRRGITPMAPRHAVAVLADVLDRGEGHLTVADVDWDTFAPMFTLRRPSPLLSALPEVAQALARPAEDTRPGDSALARRLAALPRADRERQLLDLVRTQTAAVLGHAGAADIAPARAFRDLGVDSLTSVELRDRLNTATGLSLPATVAFDQPSAVVLAGHLHAELFGDDAAAAPEVATRGDHESIAIVGIGCRYPGGVDGPERFWSLLADGVDAVGAFPADRGWTVVDDPAAPFAHQGGFVHDAPDFDPAFFGISPREALAMDPQQRMLLEVSWESLEDAGIDPATLRGSRTGVFAGASASGYSELMSTATGAAGYLLTGNAGSVISGRVAYTLGLEGPAVTIDTACSSSLVGLHLAAAALRSGECTLALAGGVAVMATPGAFGEFAKQQGLASDGRCKAFADAADGTGWAEGAGMLVLERLSDAQHNGHSVLAVIRGSATNSDGASNGLAAPNGPSQQRVIRAALANAGLGVGDIDAVEAHGTGTSLGDPIEAQALLATYGQDRDVPLWLGSVKSNIGHTQTAAGVAGVIKMVQALRHGQLPATLHVESPSSKVDWSAGNVRLLTEAVPWPPADRPRRAGVSAFGISGTNAHVIIEEAPAEAPAAESQDDAGSPVPATVSPLLTGISGWLVSGRTAADRTAVARRLHEHLHTHPDTDPAAVAWSLATTRSVWQHRGVAFGPDGLDELAAGIPGPASVTGVADSVDRSVFVFPGQGSQWLGMGRELAGSCSVFAERLAECAAALAPWVDWSLEEILSSESIDFQSAGVVQPVLWAVMVSLAAVWEAAGVEPAAVVGHSQGEIAAAVVAGVLSLEDGARVVALRSKALEALAGHGGMVSVAAPVATVQGLIGDTEVSIAAVNGPSSTVVSGSPDALQALIGSAKAAGIRTRTIAVDYASHSAQVENLQAEIVDVLQGIQPQQARIAMVSSRTGQPVTGPELDPGYWYASLRETVRFSDAIETLAGQGYQCFVECSPHPVLTGAITDTITQHDNAETPVVVGTLRRDDGGPTRLLTSLAEAWTHGLPITWHTILTKTTTVDLPSYPFARERFWPEPVSSTANDGDAEFWDALEQGKLDELAESLVIDRASLDAVAPALTRWRRSQRQGTELDSWRYRISWQPVSAPTSSTLTGRWLVVGEAPEVVDALTAGGAEARLVRPDELTAALEDGTPNGIVSAVALDAGPDPRYPAVPRGLAQTLHLVQVLDAVEAPLWVLTRGAVATNPTETPDPRQAEVWGFGRVAALEHPTRWGGLIDLPETGWDERCATALRGILAAAAGSEDQLALRGNGVLARRLVRAPKPRSAASPWSPTGSVLVTGGTGAVGGQVAHWLAQREAARVVLTSRSGAAAADTAQLAAHLAHAGTAVDVLACDVADRADVAAVLDRVAATGPAVSAVVHAAGVSGGGPIAGTSVQELADVTEAKVTGARHLDELTGDLDAFVLFSSAAATWGSSLQPGYAAGNAYLDALADARRARGERATSVAWGLWGGAGLGQDHSEQLQRAGLRAMNPDLAVRALGCALDAGETTVTVADVDWDRFAPAFSMRRPSPLLAALPDAATQPIDAEPGVAIGLDPQLAGQPRAEQLRVLTELVRAEAAAVLGHRSRDAVPSDHAFRDLGFDSLTAVDLRNRLTAATGLALPTTLVFDYPNATMLADHLGTQLYGQLAAEPVFTDLDRLEATLAGLPGGSSELRADVTARLRTVLSKWLAGTTGTTGDSVNGRLEAASADEVLDFINNELGVA